jgi:predicted RNase H-like HicB family nuclease
MDFYTTVLRKSGSYWVALCLENGIVGQGHTKEAAVTKLKEAIGSIEEAKNGDEDIYSAPLSIKELHEFLMIEGIESVPESLELRALNACPIAPGDGIGA